MVSMFWPFGLKASGILVPQLGTEPAPSALEGSLNHWTAREVPPWHSCLVINPRCGWAAGHYRIFGNISGLEPLDASHTPSPGHDNQQRLQTLPAVPRLGVKSPPVENVSGRIWGVPVTIVVSGERNQKTEQKKSRKTTWFSLVCTLSLKKII